MAKPRGQGAHTLKPDREERRESIRARTNSSWWTVLDRWDAVPAGYALLVCGCPAWSLDGARLFRQEWILPLASPPAPKGYRRAPKVVPSPTGAEGDIHPVCGQPFMEVRGGRPVPLPSAVPVVSAPAPSVAAPGPALEPGSPRGVPALLDSGVHGSYTPARRPAPVLSASARFPSAAAERAWVAAQRRLGLPTD